MTNLINREPAMLSALIQAAVALSTSFGLNLTAEQIGTIMAFTATLLGLLTRSKVTPTKPQ